MNQTPTPQTGSAARRFLQRLSAHHGPIPVWLGLGGLIPFVLGAMACWLLGLGQVRVIHWGMTLYAVSIVSFVGALNWGYALVQSSLEPQQRDRLFFWSVVPSLLACTAALLPTPISLFGLAAVGLLALVADLRLRPLLQLPNPWYHLRILLTLVASASLCIAGLRLLLVPATQSL